MDEHQLINQDSGNVEYFTPSAIVEAARRVMGSIELDPASCAKANETIRAERFYDEAMDGYNQPWVAQTLWLNHPFGREEQVCDNDCKKKTCAKRGHHVEKYKPGNKQWVDKLEASYRDGLVGEACCICFASTSEGWFRPLLFRPQCFLSPRTNYVGPDGKIVQGVSKGSVVTYFGTNVAAFAREFAALGVVKIPYPA
jgi:hypothetical protein